MTTMKDVAHKAGVSIATVSRVINDTGFVSQELKNQVHEAMTTLNYRPSHVARSLRRQQTQTIAVMVPQLDQPFFSTLTFAIQQRLFADDYYTFTCSTVESEEEEAAYVEMLLGQSVDGVVVAPTGHSADTIRRLQQANVPVVLVDRDLPELSAIDRVLFDNYTGGHLGAKHLVELGHEHITILAGLDHSHTIKQRIEGITAALGRHGIQPNIVTGENDLHQFEVGYQRALDILSAQPRPTAIFALTDIAAVGTIHAAHELGLNVPGDLSLIGFDNIPLAQYSLPALTTIAQPIRDMGEQTAELLLRRLESPDRDPVTITCGARLIVRGSTQPPTSAYEPSSAHHTQQDA